MTKEIDQIDDLLNKKDKKLKNESLPTQTTTFTQNEDDALFTTNLDFLFFKLLNIFTVNDKPLFFIVPILIISLTNIFIEILHPIYLSFILFFAYEYCTGNGIIMMGRDALVYFTVNFLVYFMKKYFLI